MVLRKRKYESGAATAYITRNQALKKLQLSLPDFRRICILKGIHPHEPRHRKIVGRGSTAPKTYYFLKDIQFIAHEPILNKFRDFKIFLRKLKKAEDKRQKGTIDRLKQNRPNYKLDHIVKERYPSFVDAIRDLDDCLTMTFMFATFPKSKKVYTHQIQLCRQLTVEFLHYVIASKSLRKVFISIKGIYYQAEILGQTVTWITPHRVGYKNPQEVDFRIMTTFIEFYSTMLGFINYRLYNSIGLHYPPQLSLGLETKHTEDDDDDDDDDPLAKDELEEKLSALTQCLTASVQEPQDEEMDEFPSELTNDPDHVEKAKLEQEKLKQLQSLFKGLKFFLNREVPRESLTFIIRSLGGQVSWEHSLALGATYQESDESITHHIVDRPAISNQYLSRYYIQPQWLFDSINTCRLVPAEDYFLGTTLPPHLSPFVKEGEGDYIPPERQRLLDPDSGIANSSEEEDDEEDNDEDEEHGKDDVQEAESDSDDDNDEEEEDDDNDDKEDDDDDNSDDESAGLEKKYEVKRSKRKRPNDTEEEPVKSSKASRKAQMSVSSGTVEKVDADRKLQTQTNEERKLAEMMIPKKKRRLYSKIMFSRKRKARESRKLKEKREAYDQEQRKEKKKQKKAKS